MSGSRGMLAAKQPLVVPMLLRLSHFKLNSYVVLVVSKQKGITLVFKTDPLQSVDINSTFDSIAVIQKFIQREIEGQLRQMFREDLPGIIHRLSQQWVKATVEAPYLSKRPPPTSRYTFDSRFTPDLSFHNAGLPNVGMQPHLLRQHSSDCGRSRTSSAISTASTSRRMAATAATSPLTSPPNPGTPDAVSSFPDLENFDPTYGLRPEGLPTKSVFRGFSSLFTPNKGLADLAEERSEASDYDDEAASFDLVDWDDAVPEITPPPSAYDEERVTEYETIPAVGGGMITRPRVYHSQSLIQPDITSSKSMPSLLGISTMPRPLDHLPRSGLATPHRPSSFLDPNFSAFPISSNRGFPSSASMSGSTFRTPHTAPPYYTTPGRPVTPDSLETQPSHSSSGMSPSMVSTSPSSVPAHADDEAAIYMRRSRRLSLSSLNNVDAFHSGSPPNYHSIPEPDPTIVLRPSLNNSIHQLSSLSFSNHTLSPYTRSLEHFTVRSFPPRCPGSSGLSLAAERQPVKAKRKRTYRLGGHPKATLHIPDADDSQHPPSSPVPPSEFDASDMDRYFRFHDDLIPCSPDVHPTHVRRRQPYDPA